MQTGDRPPQWMQLRTQCVNGVFNQTVIKLDYFFPLCFLSEAALSSVHLQFLPTCYPSGRKKFTRNFFFFRQPDVPDVPDVCLFIHEMFFFLLWAKIFIGHFRGVGIKKKPKPKHTNERHQRPFYLLLFFLSLQDSASVSFSYPLPL